MKKNILFFTILCCAINIISGPKENKKVKDCPPSTVKVEPPTPAVKIDHPPKSPLDEEFLNVDPSILEQTKPLNSPLTVPPHAQAPEISISPQAPAESPMPASFSQPANLSAEEMNQLKALQELEEKERKKTAKLEELKAELQSLRDTGWDLGEEDDAKLVQAKNPIPQKSWFKRLVEVPNLWWEEHVTNPNRLEHLARFLGTIRTYTILCQKINNGELEAFIKNLNAANAEEGDTWLNEALHQAVLDRKENIIRRLITAARPYKAGLTPKTREAVLKFLTNCADKKRKDFTEECNEFALDQHSLALAMLEAEQDTPDRPDILTEVVEQCAIDAALALTKCASGGYLPRKPIKQ